MVPSRSRSRPRSGSIVHVACRRPRSHGRGRSGFACCRLLLRHLGLLLGNLWDVLRTPGVVGVPGEDHYRGLEVFQGPGETGRVLLGGLVSLQSGVTCFQLLVYFKNMFEVLWLSTICYMYYYQLKVALYTCKTWIF